MLILIALAAIVRGAYFAEIANSPCREFDRCPETDMRFFADWANRLSGGDWLLDRALHPHFGWHAAVAEEYFRAYPEEEARAADIAAEREDLASASEAVWDRWHGGKRFHQAPLYPYFVAITESLVGTDRQWVFAAQMLLGVVSTLLAYLLARRLFGELTGIVAGLFFALCGPILFFEGVMIRSSMITFAGLAVVYLITLALEKRTVRCWLFTGLACGAAVTLKPTLLVLPLGAAVIASIRGREQPRVTVRLIGALGIGFAAALLPVAARNATVGVSPFSLSSVGGVAFAAANAGEFEPERGFYPEAKHLARVLAQSDGHLGATAIATLKTHDSVWSYADQLGKKLRLMWDSHEQPNNVNFYYYRLHSIVLRFLPFTFFVVGPLGIVGLVLGARRRGTGPLLLLLALHAATLLGFYVLARFRAPFAAALIPFAALAATQIVRWFAEKRIALGIGTVAATVFLGAAIPPSRPADEPLVRAEDYVIAYRGYYDRRLKELTGAGDWHSAVALLRESLEIRPAGLDEIGAKRPPGSAGEIVAAQFYAAVYRAYSIVLDRAGDASGAQIYGERANELDTAAVGARR